MLFLSTAGSFDGRQDIYDDGDDLALPGRDAHSKCIEEILASRNPRRHFVCSAGWIMRRGPSKDKTFIQKWISEIGARSNQLAIEDSKPGSLAYTHELARNVTGLFGQEFRQVDNMACGRVRGQLEVAQDFMRLIGKAHSITPTPVSSALFAVGFLTSRPGSGRRIMKKLDRRRCNSCGTGMSRFASILAVIAMAKLNELHVVAGYE